jgi:hypothetical protein
MSRRLTHVNLYDTTAGKVIGCAKVLAFGLIPLNIAIAAVSSWGAVALGTRATHNLGLPDRSLVEYGLMALAGIASTAVLALFCTLFYRPVIPAGTDARQDWEPWKPIIRREAMEPATNRKPILAFALLALAVGGAAAFALGTLAR